MACIFFLSFQCEARHCQRQIRHEFEISWDSSDYSIQTSLRSPRSKQWKLGEIIIRQIRRIDFFCYRRERAFLTNSQRHVRPTIRALRLGSLRTAGLDMHLLILYASARTMPIGNWCLSFSKALLHFCTHNCSLSKEKYLSYNLKTNQALISIQGK